MADAKRKKLPQFTSPRGVFVYPWINKPDTKFNADGEFRLKLRVSEDDAATIIKQLDKAHADAVVEAKAKLKAEGKPTKNMKIADKPYTLELDKETEEPTGHVLINFKQKAKGKNKTTGEEFTRTIPIWDATGKNKVTKNVFGGSEGKVAYEIQPYYTAQVGAGISLRLKQVQVLKLVAGNGEQSAFGAEEGYEEESAPPFNENDSNNGEGSEGGKAGADDEDF